ncbi:MAG: hypothetical protein K5777_05115 [Nitrosopumilus sp.]|nr:hypothetical protein [Nitrosopumilus sp.]
MNLYDKKMVKCTECDKTVGEIDMEVEVKDVVCNKCQNKKQKENESSFSFLNKRMIETTI